VVTPGLEKVKIQWIMNKNLIIGVLAVATIWYFMKAQNNAAGYLAPGNTDNQPVKPERVSGVNLDKVHNVV